MSPKTWGKGINMVLYQLGWFSCVLGAAWEQPLAGAGLALFLLLIHLLLADNRPAELKLIAAACLCGIMVDSLQQASGLFTFRTDPRWPLWLPLWVFVIWAQFATLFRHALYWLNRRYLLGALFGFFGGPLAYWSGIRLGAAEFGHAPAITLIVLAAVWSLVVPLLLWLHQQIDTREGFYRAITSGDYR